MPRRNTKNRTGISRIENPNVHRAWIGFNCLACQGHSELPIGDELLSPDKAFAESAWLCRHCNYVHSKKTDLPRWENWPLETRAASSLPAQRFWQGFFRIHTEHPESYWKQCNVCARVQPFAAFSKHVGWGPLARQMECRSCKGAINAVLNPKRTKEQLHESAARRRVADLLLKGENERLVFADLFARFEGRCFKTRQTLNINDRKSWAIDHILPSSYLYPLSSSNACLLSAEANQAKKARWPSKCYSNSELVQLAQITGADLTLLSGEPLVNSHIDVDACVSRVLAVRERSNLGKRLDELRALLSDYQLVDKLSAANRKLLGF